MKIFISYSRVDRPHIEKIVDDLHKILTNHPNSTQINVWFDREITGGHQWWSTILKVIEECELFIFVMSSSSLASVPCRLERVYAHELNKSILPLLVDKNLDIGLVPPELQLIHFVNYTERTIESYQNLQQAITNLPASLSPPSVMPERPAAPLNSLGQVKEMLHASELPREVQQNILDVIVEHLSYPTEQQRALALLKEFKTHPDVRGAILTDINLAITKTKAQPVLKVVNDHLGGLKEIPNKMKPTTLFVARIWLYIRNLHPVIQFVSLVLITIGLFYAGYFALGIGVLLLVCVGPIWLLTLLWRFTKTKPKN